MRQDSLDDFTEVQRAQACMLKAWADFRVCYCGSRRFRGPLTIPDDWTVWLLMDKAGVPRDLIAYYCYVDRRSLDARLRIAKAALIFSPFAARVEAMSRLMPQFNAPGRNAEPELLEAPCAAAAE